MTHPSQSHFSEMTPATFELEKVVGSSRKKQPSYLLDHRSRLRARFLEAGAAAMPDYELLELVLFRKYHGVM